MTAKKTKLHKSIAIIYYNAGLGHLREALAVRDILRPEGHSLELIDFNEMTGGSYSDVGDIYEKMQRNGLAKIVSFSGWRNPPDFILKFANRIERDKEKRFTASIEKYLVKNKIDFIINTHFFPAGALACSQQFRKRAVNIVVDNLWKNSAWVYAVPGLKTVVPTEESFKNVYLNGIFGLEKKDITLAGHPFPPDLVKEKDNMQKKRLAKYGSDAPLTILATTGGAGTNEKEMLDIMAGGKDMIRSNKVNLVLWCNHHTWLHASLLKKARSLNLGKCNNLRIHSTKTKIEAIYGLHDQIKDADLLVTKPGELAQYGGLAPLYLFEPTSSQEYSLADVSYQYRYSRDVKDIGAKNLIIYADSHRDELRDLADNGMKNPLVKMQEENKLLGFFRGFINNKQLL